jgi:hypothetical protein
MTKTVDRTEGPDLMTSILAKAGEHQVHPMSDDGG